MAYDKPRMGYRHTLVRLLYTVFFPNSIRLATKKRWRKFRMSNVRNGNTKLYLNFNFGLCDNYSREANKITKRCTEA